MEVKNCDFDGFNVFFRFLVEIRLRTLIKLPQKSKFSTQNVQIPYHLHPALSNSLNSVLQIEGTLCEPSQCNPVRPNEHQCEPKGYSMQFGAAQYMPM